MVPNEPNLSIGISAGEAFATYCSARFLKDLSGVAADRAHQLCKESVAQKQFGVWCDADLLPGISKSHEFKDAPLQMVQYCGACIQVPRSIAYPCQQTPVKLFGETGIDNPVFLSAPSHVVSASP